VVLISFTNYAETKSRMEDPFCCVRYNVEVIAYNAHTFSAANLGRAECHLT